MKHPINTMTIAEFCASSPPNGEFKTWAQGRADMFDVWRESDAKFFVWLAPQFASPDEIRRFLWFCEWHNQRPPTDTESWHSCAPAERLGELTAANAFRTAENVSLNIAGWAAEDAVKAGVSTDASRVAREAARAAQAAWLRANIRNPFTPI